MEAQGEARRHTQTQHLSENVVCGLWGVSVDRHRLPFRLLHAEGIWSKPEVSRRRGDEAAPDQVRMQPSVRVGKFEDRQRSATILGIYRGACFSSSLLLPPSIRIRFTQPSISTYSSHQLFRTPKWSTFPRSTRPPFARASARVSSSRRSPRLPPRTTRSSSRCE